MAGQRQWPGDSGGRPPGGPPGRARRMAAPVLCPWRASGARLGSRVGVGAHTPPPVRWGGLLGHPRMDGGGNAGVWWVLAANGLQVMAFIGMASYLAPYLM